jgi:hypothetical protein
MGISAEQQAIIDGVEESSGNGLSVEQQEIISGLDKQNLQDLGGRDINTSSPPPPAEKAQVRSTFQGVTLGFADEMEAFARSMVEKAPYEEIRDKIRAKLNAYQEQYPGEAISYELLGALAPTALAYLSPVPGDEVGITGYLTGRSANVAQKGANWLQRAKTPMKIGAVEGGLAGYGTGEEGVVKDLSRVPMGAGLGTVFSGGTSVAMDLGGTLVNNVLTKSRSLFGDKGANAVSQELRRLVESTGKTEDEVILGIAQGEIIADNATLEAVMRALRAEMGESGADIDRVLRQRATSTKEGAQQELQQGLTPDVDGNVYKAYTLGDDAAKAQENKLYKAVFENAQEVSPQIAQEIQDILKRLPNAKETLGEIYQAKGGLVPFFKILDNGEVQMVRMPSLEDAEIIRRVAGESASGAFQSGKGALGEPISALETKLRAMLDEFSPNLKAVRQNASNIRTARDAYKMGRGALNKNVDELSVDMERLIGVSPTVQNASSLKAFRAGVMVALRDKIRKMPTFFEKASKEGEHFNELLRVVFPGEKIDDLIQKVKIAGQSKQTERRVLYGSPTAPQEKASDLLGLSTRATAGDPTAMIGLASKLISDLRPRMSETQRTQLVKLLLSEDPDFVRKALMDESIMAKLQQKISDFGRATQRATERGVAFESGEAGGDLDTGLLKMFTE